MNRSILYHLTCDDFQNEKQVHATDGYYRMAPIDEQKDFKEKNDNVSKRGLFTWMDTYDAFVSLLPDIINYLDWYHPAPLDGSDYDVPD